MGFNRLVLRPFFIRTGFVQKIIRKDSATRSIQSAHKKKKEIYLKAFASFGIKAIEILGKLSGSTFVSLVISETSSGVTNGQLFLCLISQVILFYQVAGILYSF